MAETTSTRCPHHKTIRILDVMRVLQVALEQLVLELEHTALASTTELETTSLLPQGKRTLR